MTYQIVIVPGSSAQRIKKTEDDGTVWTFRANGQNCMSLEYQAWLAEGNEPLPADEPPTD